MKVKTKTFDCVEMQHKGGDGVRAQMGGMTLEEQAAFWRRQTERLRQEQDRLREKRP